jgi:hypothetical protein
MVPHQEVAASYSNKCHSTRRLPDPWNRRPDLAILRLDEWRALRVMLEILHGPFVLFGGRARGKSAQVSPLAGSRVFLA